MNNFDRNPNISINNIGTMSNLSVLKNTYMLLSMSLIFSAITAGISISLNVAPISPWIFLIVTMGLSFFINATAESSVGLLAVFLFTGFIGAYTGPILNAIMTHFHNGSQLIMTALGGTGLIFMSLSSYILISKKDLSFMTTMLFTGSIVAIILGIGGLLFHIPALQLAVSAMFMLISSGLIAWETSNIIHGGETNYIRATVSLYMSIYNLFISLLNILMALRGDD